MFNSLGRYVTIGSLKKGVADASLNKQKGAEALRVLPPRTTGEEEKEEIEKVACDVLAQIYTLWVQPLAAEACPIAFIETQYLGTNVNRVDTTVSIRFFILLNRKRMRYDY